MIVFDNLQTCLTETHSTQPFCWWNAEAEGWESILGGRIPTPGVKSLPRPLVEDKNQNIYIHYDILGLTYWMLARLEEIDRKDLDNEQRFPATASHAFKNGYLDRPVVDEWFHVLRQVISKKWPEIELRNSKYKTIVTCDVDHPFEYSGNLRKLVRRFAGDLLKRKSAFKAFKNLLGEIMVFLNNWSFDENFNGLEFIMNECEEKDHKVIFFFISYKTHNIKDIDAGINRRVLKLFKLISDRGHTIGIHPGYNTFNNKKNLEYSYDKFVTKLKEVGLDHPKIISRQHYLRWSTPQTQNLLEGQGIAYDSTLSYADKSGFRCGTCHQYSMFDATSQREMKIKQIPLIIMECSVLDEKYMKMKEDDALEYMIELKNKCKNLGGSFVLLWHNSSLIKESYRNLLKKIISD